MNEEECEHELNLINESWISNEEVEIDLSCDVCNANFKGTVKKW